MPGRCHAVAVQMALAFIVVFSLVLMAVDRSASAQQEPDTVPDTARVPAGFEEAPFDGEILPVFYVRDVLRSVAFYVDSLGFVCDHYFDHINGGSVTKWTYDEPPLYAEMRAGQQKFALHRTSNPDSLIVGGTRTYFGVTDVREHRRVVTSKGLRVGDLIERPWMNMYRVVDPDGHELYIFTRPPENEE